ncbi:MAG TPA: hypothetical protein VEZ50_05905 [Nodosilinea sp.]|nr:hypothetical protein [Nodosilinea sp.]
MVPLAFAIAAGIASLIAQATTRSLYSKERAPKLTPAVAKALSLKIRQ